MWRKGEGIKTGGIVNKVNQGRPMSLFQGI
ncbi:hypothetical protein ES707_12468 [subsurface metagenome]